MKILYTRTFPSYTEAMSYLEERGKLEFFGSLGPWGNMYYVYNILLYDGRKYTIFVYQSGKVEVVE